MELLPFFCMGKWVLHAHISFVEKENKKEKKLRLFISAATKMIIQMTLP